MSLSLSSHCKTALLSWSCFEDDEPPCAEEIEYTKCCLPLKGFDEDLEANMSIASSDEEKESDSEQTEIRRFQDTMGHKWIQAWRIFCRGHCLQKNLIKLDVEVSWGWEIILLLNSACAVWNFYFLNGRNERGNLEKVFMFHIISVSLFSSVRY